MFLFRSQFRFQLECQYRVHLELNATVHRLLQAAFHHGTKHEQADETERDQFQPKGSCGVGSELLLGIVDSLSCVQHACGGECCDRNQNPTEEHIEHVQSEIDVWPEDHMERRQREKCEKQDPRASLNRSKREENHKEQPLTEHNGRPEVAIWEERCNQDLSSAANKPW
eukprot:CAMPEP_0175868252 /NCGR_PEP_ID=MMETSP0107_2-20121207/35290_1 /TAXON_ID=195067 ORGANISM="Goniomonas pacifica, Strain CCMP1869" /NCGR_SAMPLE_ID=MMETSP0107_2 /ASSEMBLY_ACC=CAM_ASM_000203 /LENGTH=168 /DNA_ID=CAMNT_0017186127 /DNA_START=24 /DNA_END=530 /DNA_ORIENTATION=+